MSGNKTVETDASVADFVDSVDHEQRRAGETLSYTELAAALLWAARDRPEPSHAQLLLYVTSILRYVLRLSGDPQGVERLRQIPFLKEVLRQGETR